MKYIKITRKELMLVMRPLVISVIISLLVGLIDIKAVVFYIAFLIVYIFTINSYRLIIEKKKKFNS